MEAQLTSAHRTLTLTIRATNGANWKTDDFKPDDTVGRVIRKALKHFVRTGAMADGDYALALLGHGDPRVLSDADTLASSGVHNRDTLALVARTPQVDG
jgi:hypothetical protein